MKIIALSDAPAVPFNIDGRIMFSNNKVEVVHLSLAPGEKLEIHDNMVDVVFYMLEGSAFLLLEEGETEITTDTCFELGKGILRGWENRSRGNARLLVIKQIN